MNRDPPAPDHSVHVFIRAVSKQTRIHRKMSPGSLNLDAGLEEVLSNKGAWVLQSAHGRLSRGRMDLIRPHPLLGIIQRGPMQQLNTKKAEPRK